MAYTHAGKTYRSKKFFVLEYIFNKYNRTWEAGKDIEFTLADITEGYTALDIPKPVSTSNTILDLLRQNRGIGARLPESIYSLGYDLRKRTGSGPSGANLAGAFIFVGKGNELSDWLIWPTPDEIHNYDESTIPSSVTTYLRRDEGALFSVIDYLDIFSSILSSNVHRAQAPLKWQPNEIDGFYVDTDGAGDILMPVEAKAISTKDDVSIPQLVGELNTFSEKIFASYGPVRVRPTAVQGIKGGMNIGFFDLFTTGESISHLHLDKFVRVNFTKTGVLW
jgi:hypothetical protein